MSPKPRREPHVMVTAMVGENGKLACLPNDTARLGYFYVVLGKAKLQRPSGRFASRNHWREVAGRFAKYLPQYLDAGLVEEAPRLCPRCAPKWPDLPAGSVVVHDWHDHQSDPGAAERAQEWRREHAEEDAPAIDWEGIERPQNEDRTPIERGMNAERTAIGRSLGVHSRAGARREQEQELEQEEIRESPAHAKRAHARSEGWAKALSWLAKHGVYVAESSTNGHVEHLDRLLAQHGWAAVLDRFEAMAGESHELRQYVLGADNALNRIPKASERDLSDEREAKAAKARAAKAKVYLEDVTPLDDVLGSSEGGAS